MADALISLPVAAAAGAVAVTLIAVSAKKAREEGSRSDIALMGVLGAFVFVAQMINFTIPGTGSSGHIVGGILLAAFLGPWRAFLTLCSVLIVQCFVFADGGMMALGCNIINMGVMSCLVAYPLIFRPMVRGHMTGARLMWGSILANVVALEAGAFLVTVETTLSGITALPFGEFLLFMLPIHLVIGLCEGVATGLVLTFVLHKQPALLRAPERGDEHREREVKPKRSLLWLFLGAAIVLGISFWWIASGNPDGLEWSIFRVTGLEELGEASIPGTAVLADYDSHFSGLIGGVIVMAILWALCIVLFRKKRVATVPRK